LLDFYVLTTIGFISVINTDNFIIRFQFSVGSLQFAVETALINRFPTADCPLPIDRPPTEN